MKNLLLILPLAFSMSVALAQTPDTKPVTSATLDGKSFKITMTERLSASNDEKNVAPAISQDESVNQNLKMETFSNKKMILHFTNGSVTTTALTAHGITNCPYRITSHEGTLLTFNANCSGSISSTGSSTEPANITSAGSNGTDNGKSQNEAPKVNSETTTSGTVLAMWSGTVEGNNVRGNFTWTNESGQKFYYTFTGMKASPKDLNEVQELGSK